MDKVQKSIHTGDYTEAYFIQLTVIVINLQLDDLLPNIPSK
jgi:hypothetical protein